MPTRRDSMLFLKNQNIERIKNRFSDEENSAKNENGGPSFTRCRITTIFSKNLLKCYDGSSRTNCLKNAIGTFISVDKTIKMEVLTPSISWIDNESSKESNPTITTSRLRKSYSVTGTKTFD